MDVLITYHWFIYLLFPITIITSLVTPICHLHLPLSHASNEQGIITTYLCGYLDHSSLIGCIPRYTSFSHLQSDTDQLQPTRHLSSCENRGSIHRDICNHTMVDSPDPHGVTPIYSIFPSFRMYYNHHEPTRSSDSITALACEFSFQHGHDICHVAHRTTQISSSQSTSSRLHPLLPSDAKIGSRDIQSIMVPMSAGITHHRQQMMSPLARTPLNTRRSAHRDEPIHEDGKEYILGYFCYSNEMDSEFYSPFEEHTNGLCDYSHRRVAESLACRDVCPCQEDPPVPQCYFVRYDDDLKKYEYIATYEEDCYHLQKPRRIASPALYSECPTVKYVQLQQQYSYPDTISMFNSHPVVVSLPLFKDFTTALLTGYLTDLDAAEHKNPPIIIFKDMPYNNKQQFITQFRPPRVSKFMLTIVSSYGTPNQLTHITHPFVVHDECSLPLSNCNPKGTRCGNLSGHCHCLDGYIYSPTCHVTVEISHSKAMYLVEHPDATPDDVAKVVDEYMLWSSDPNDLSSQITMDSIIRISGAKSYSKLSLVVIVDSKRVYTTQLTTNVFEFVVRDHLKTIGTSVQLGFSTVDDLSIHPPLHLASRLGCHLLNQVKNPSTSYCTAYKDKVQFSVKGKILHMIVQWVPPSDEDKDVLFFARLFDANQAFVSVLTLAYGHKKDRVVFSKRSHPGVIHFIIPSFAFPGLANGGGSVMILPWDINAPISYQQSYPFDRYEISICTLLDTKCPESQSCNEFTGKCMCDHDRWGESCQYKRSSSLVGDPLDICPLSYLSCSRRGVRYTRDFKALGEDSYCQCRCEAYWTNSSSTSNEKADSRADVYIPRVSDWHDPNQSTPVVQCAVCGLECPGTMVPTDDCTACRCLTDDCKMRTYTATLSFDKRAFFNHVPRPRRESFMQTLRFGLYRQFMSPLDLFDLQLMPISTDLPFRIRLTLHFYEDIASYSEQSEEEFIKSHIDLINTERWNPTLLAKYFGHHFRVFQVISNSGLTILPFRNQDYITTVCQEYASPQEPYRQAIKYSPCPSTSRLDYRYWGPCTRGRYALLPRCFIGENYPLPTSECTRVFPDYPLIAELPCDNQCNNGYTWNDETSACDEPPFLFNLGTNVTQVFLGDNITLNWDYHGDPRNTALITLHFLQPGDNDEPMDTTTLPNDHSSILSRLSSNAYDAAARSYAPPRRHPARYFLPARYSTMEVTHDANHNTSPAHMTSFTLQDRPRVPYHRLLGNIAASGGIQKPVYLTTVFAISEVALVTVPVEYFTEDTYVFFRITIVRTAHIVSDSSSTPTLVKIRRCRQKCDPDTERCNVQTGRCECIDGFVPSSYEKKCVPMCKELCLNGGECRDDFLSLETGTSGGGSSSGTAASIPPSTECVCKDPYFGEFCEQSLRCSNICGKGFQLVLNDGLCGPCECLPAWEKDMKTQLCTRCLLDPNVNQLYTASSTLQAATDSSSFAVMMHRENPTTLPLSVSRAMTVFTPEDRLPVARVYDIKPCFNLGTLPRSYIDCTACYCRIGFMGDFCQHHATYGTFTFTMPARSVNATIFPYQTRWGDSDLDKIITANFLHDDPLYNLITLMNADTNARLHEHVVTTLGILPSDAHIIQVTREEKTFEHVYTEASMRMKPSVENEKVTPAAALFRMISHGKKDTRQHRHQQTQEHLRPFVFRTLENRLSSIYLNNDPKEKYIETNVVMAMTDSYIQSTIDGSSNSEKFHSPRVLTLDALHKAWEDWQPAWNQTALAYDPSIKSSYGELLPVGELYEPNCRSMASHCPQGRNPFQGVVQTLPGGQIDVLMRGSRSNRRNDSMITWIIIGCVGLAVLSVLAAGIAIYCCKKHHYGCFKQPSSSSLNPNNELKDNERVQGHHIQQVAPGGYPLYPDSASSSFSSGSFDESGTAQRSEWKLIRERTGHIYYLNRLTNEVVPMYTPGSAAIPPRMRSRSGSLTTSKHGRRHLNRSQRR